MARLFRPNKKTTIAELEEYYASQRTNDGTIRAWLMAILSLLITVAIILGLFFAARWAWRAITDNDDDKATSTSQTEGVIVREDGSLEGDLSLLNGASSGTVTVDAGNNSGSNVGVVSNEAASTDNDTDEDDSVIAVENGDADDATEDSTSDNDGVVGSEATELPNTGANILALPIIAGIAGYVASAKRKLNR